MMNKEDTIKLAKEAGFEFNSLTKLKEKNT